MRANEAVGQGLDELGLAGADACAEQYVDVPFITAAEFGERPSSESWVIVDVCTARERRLSSIPGAVSQAIADRRPDRIRARSILVVCTVGWRSAAYAATLRREGHAAFSLYGGMLAWVANGRAAVDADGESTTRVAGHGAF